MLEDLLKDYSEGELAEFLGEGVISDYGKITDNQLSKKDFIKAVSTLYGYTIVSDKNHRDRLIDRMAPEVVDKILIEFLRYIGKGSSIAPISNKYSALMKLADNFEIKFITYLGFGESLISTQDAQRSVQGIRALQPQYALYPYQVDMVAKVNELILNDNVSRCLLHLPTGAGKTRTAMNVACEHLRGNPEGLVLWLADTSELCMQATEEFTKAWGFLGNRELKQYSYFSDSEISLGGIDSGFLVAGLQKVHKTRGSREHTVLYELLRKQVTLVIFDEAHKAIAPTYAKTVSDMIDGNDHTFLMGLSATPGRSLEFNTDEDERLSEFFGSNKITMHVPGYQSPVQYLVEKQYLAKAEFIGINYDGSQILLSNKSSNNKLTAQIKTVLSDDDARNMELMRVICGEYDRGSSIIIFACNVEHSQRLATMLAFKGVPAYSLDSKADNEESRRFKIAEYTSGRVRVLVNYGILTAGFDVPRTNVSIIARPTDSLVQYSQMAGRAMRGKHSKGNDNCRIYTVRDDIPSFSSVAKAFSHWDSLWNEVNN